MKPGAMATILSCVSLAPLLPLPLLLTLLAVRFMAGSWLTVLCAPVCCFLAVGLELEGVAAGDAVPLACCF
jgi:hypothetical protein